MTSVLGRFKPSSEVTRNLREKFSLPKLIFSKMKEVKYVLERLSELGPQKKVADEETRSDC